MSLEIPGGPLNVPSALAQGRLLFPLKGLSWGRERRQGGVWAGKELLLGSSEGNSCGSLTYTPWDMINLLRPRGPETSML